MDPKYVAWVGRRSSCAKSVFSVASTPHLRLVSKAIIMLLPKVRTKYDQAVGAQSKGSLAAYHQSRILCSLATALCGRVLERIGRNLIDRNHRVRIQSILLNECIMVLWCIAEEAWVKNEKIRYLIYVEARSTPLYQLTRIMIA